MCSLQILYSLTRPHPGPPLDTIPPTTSHFYVIKYQMKSNLEKRITKIEQRNKNVTIDKAWETSTIRKILLAIFTYLTIGFYLNAININQPWLNAIVPSIGFLLSTLTLPFFKKIWIKYFYFYE